MSNYLNLLCLSLVAAGCSGGEKESLATVDRDVRNVPADSQIIDSDLETDSARAAALETELNPTPVERGGQTGGIGADSVSYTRLEVDQQGTLGFSPQQAMDTFLHECTTPFHYVAGEATEMTVSLLLADGAVRESAEKFGASDVRFFEERWDANTENNAIKFDVEVSFSTADGRFSERFRSEFTASSLSDASFYWETSGDALMGSYQAPMALRQAVEAADLAAGETARYRASTIMAVAQLEAVEGAILCRGQVREHEQNPEAEEFDIIYQPYAEW